MDPYDPSYVADHHLYPQQYEDWFQQHGVDNIHDYTVAVLNDEHRQIHPTWNTEWQWFIDDHPNATREQIENQLAEMMDDYGILNRDIHHWGEGTGAVGYNP